MTSLTMHLNSSRNNECKMKRSFVAILRYEYERIVILGIPVF